MSCSGRLSIISCNYTFSYSDFQSILNNYVVVEVFFIILECKL